MDLILNKNSFLPSLRKPWKVVLNVRKEIMVCVAAMKQDYVQGVSWH